jgi:hypothetical protein
MIKPILRKVAIPEKVTFRLRFFLKSYLQAQILLVVQILLKVIQSFHFINPITF